MIEFSAEQQQWIDSHYLALPLDADGVPIRVGDRLHSDETGVDFPCRGYNVRLDGRNEKRWTIECSYDAYSGTSEYVSAKSCHHVEPRTVEDVLLDVIEHAICPSNSWDEIIAKYAQELRMVGE